MDYQELVNQSLTTANINGYLGGVSQQSLANACAVYWPNYSWPTCVTASTKFEQAFKIVNKLMDKKLIKLATIGDFVKTINEIAEIL